MTYITCICGNKFKKDYSTAVWYPLSDLKGKRHDAGEFVWLCAECGYFYTEKRDEPTQKEKKLTTVTRHFDINKKKN